MAIHRGRNAKLFVNGQEFDISNMSNMSIEVEQPPTIDMTTVESPLLEFEANFESLEGPDTPMLVYGLGPYFYGPMHVPTLSQESRLMNLIRSGQIPTVADAEALWKPDENERDIILDEEEPKP